MDRKILAYASGWSSNNAYGAAVAGFRMSRARSHSSQRFGHSLAGSFPDFEYALFEKDGERVILSVDAVERYAKELTGYTQVETFQFFCMALHCVNGKNDALAVFLKQRVFKV